MQHLLATALVCVLTLTISASIFADEQGSPSAAVENSLGMKFVLVPAGEFLMGSDESLLLSGRPLSKSLSDHLIAANDL
ncbi:hypothetical protein [Nitrosomonas communis]|uniref:hypothetical protein n=1 Tax=Nitrosomonas communis TaxID=44574 RepID=UPI003D284084